MQQKWFDITIADQIKVTGGEYVADEPSLVLQFEHCTRYQAETLATGAYNAIAGIANAPELAKTYFFPTPIIGYNDITQDRPFRAVFYFDTPEIARSAGDKAVKTFLAIHSEVIEKGLQSILPAAPSPSTLLASDDDLFISPRPPGGYRFSLN